MRRATSSTFFTSRSAVLSSFFLTNTKRCWFSVCKGSFNSSNVVFGDCTSTCAFIASSRATLRRDGDIQGACGSSGATALPNISTPQLPFNRPSTYHLSSASDGCSHLASSPLDASPPTSPISTISSLLSTTQESPSKTMPRCVRIGDTASVSKVFTNEDVLRFRVHDEAHHFTVCSNRTTTGNATTSTSNTNNKNEVDEKITTTVGGEGGEHQHGHLHLLCAAEAVLFGEDLVDKVMRYNNTCTHNNNNNNNTKLNSSTCEPTGNADIADKNSKLANGGGGGGGENEGNASDPRWPSELNYPMAVDGAMLIGLISNVLGTQLPGPQSIYLRQDTSFLMCDGEGEDDYGGEHLHSTHYVSPQQDTTHQHPRSLLESTAYVGVLTGDIVTATVTVREFIAKRGIVVLDTKIEVERRCSVEECLAMADGNSGKGGSSSSNEESSREKVRQNAATKKFVVAEGEVVGVNKVITFEGKSKYTIRAGK